MRGKDIELDINATNKSINKATKKTKLVMYGWRFYQEELDYIEKKALELSQEKGGTISQGKLMRALVYLSKRMTNDRLIKACREVS